MIFVFKSFEIVEEGRNGNSNGFIVKIYFMNNQEGLYLIN